MIIFDTLYFNKNIHIAQLYLKSILHLLIVS